MILYLSKRIDPHMVTGPRKLSNRSNLRHLFVSGLVVICTCWALLLVLSSTNQESDLKPWLTVITPTYTRPSQRVDLTRLAATLSLVEKVHWYVIENRPDVTREVQDIIDSHSIDRVTHIAYETPEGFDPRGHEQRNTAIGLVLNNYDDAVVTFSDDDNGYDWRLFEDLRQAKALRVCPVAFCLKQAVEGFTSAKGHIVHWDSYWRRVFEIDMAGFSLRLDRIRDRKPKFGAFMEGRNEDHFLRQIFGDTDELAEAGCNDGTSLWAWHIKTDVRVQGLPPNVTV